MPFTVKFHSSVYFLKLFIIRSKWMVVCCQVMLFRIKTTPKAPQNLKNSFRNRYFPPSDGSGAHILGTLWAKTKKSEFRCKAHGFRWKQKTFFCGKSPFIYNFGLFLLTKLVYWNKRRNCRCLIVLKLTQIWRSQFLFHVTWYCLRVSKFFNTFRRKQIIKPTMTTLFI